MHVYGIDDDPTLPAQQWTEGTLRWNVAPNLGGGATAQLGRLDSIDSNFVQDVGGTAHILGSITGDSSAPTTERVDVTDYIRAQTDGTATFMIIREVRFGANVDSAGNLTGEPPDTVSPVPVAYDASVDSSMWIASREHSNVAYRPVLELVTE